MSQPTTRACDTPEEPAESRPGLPSSDQTRRCRVCGCHDDDCLPCILRTGQPCFWFEPDLCSACV